MIERTTSTILFYYTVNYLWDMVLMHSGMAAKNLPEPDRFAITNDELTFFHDQMKKGFTEAYELCHKLSTGLTEGLVLNGNVSIISQDDNYDIDPNEQTNKGADPPTIMVYGFYVRNINGHYVHSLKVIDRYIELFVVDFMLREWWLKCAQGELWKVATQDVVQHRAMLNDSMYSLYKPTVTITPAWVSEDVTVDLETGNETGSETTVITEEVKEIVYCATFSSFPEVGVEDIIYVDKEYMLMYRFNNGAYELYKGKTYIETVTGTGATLNHNLGKLNPEINAVDENGDEWEVSIIPVTTIQTNVSWNGTKTLILTCF